MKTVETEQTRRRSRAVEIAFGMGIEDTARERLLSGSEIRRLQELRETVKVESLHLPVRLQRRLLEILERARPWQVPPHPIPEMTKGEIIRAIRWRLGTVPLPGAQAAAAFVAAHRIRRRAPSPPPPAPRRSFRRRPRR